MDFYNITELFSKIFAEGYFSLDKGLDMLYIVNGEARMGKLPCVSFHNQNFEELVMFGSKSNSRLIILAFVSTSTFLLSSSLYSQGELSLRGGGGQISQIHEEHQVSDFTGDWTNLFFTDNFWVWAHVGYSPPNYPWSEHNAGSNFWLIARIVGEETCYECRYEGHESYYRYDRGEITGWQWPANWLSVTPDQFNNLIPISWNIRINRNPSFIWRATVPEDREIILYYGTDLITPHGRGDEFQIMGVGAHNLFETWDSWWDYLSNGGLQEGVWAVSDPITIGGPQPPEEPIKIEFVKYLEKTATGGIIDGVDWLPKPQDQVKKWIGLVFNSTDDEEELEADLIYEIFDITTWQGVSMNYPQIINQDDIPHPTGNTDRFFDFKVDNPHYPQEQEDKYDIKIIDVDEFIDPVNHPR